MTSAIDPVRDLLPPRRALVDDVYDALLTLLMDQVIEPGSRASIEGLARMLKVSPTPVREALTRLESEGLVTKETLKGYTAAELLDAEGLDQLFAMRTLLEPEGARLAATRASQHDLDDLGALVQQMHEDARDPGHPALAAAGGASRTDAAARAEDTYESYRAFADRDAAFHHAIAELSGNDLLAEAVVRLRAHMHLYRLFFKHGIAEETSDEHDAILAALRDRDPDRAAQAMLDHITQSHARMSARVV
ncbi:GntR family transcriptional regulator [Plantibacter sp. Mn2098]|uniref:GntR family transcriptional regulator n=1 Tax=Plantibacter sp. Mn2098 TaxID=3395266 RepID=UPI003BCF4234